MKKLVARLLLVTMMMGNLPMRTYAATPAEIKGEVDIKVNLNYPIKSNKQKSSELFVKISGTKVTGDKFNLEEELQVQADETLSLDLLDVAVPQGTYTLSLEGEGYTAVSKEFKVDKHDVAIQVDANAFLAGDANQDGRVDQDDISLLEEKVGVAGYDSSYDFNRDGKIDITDLTYTYFNQQKAQINDLTILNTRLIPETVMNATDVAKELEKEGVTIKNGSVEELFQGEDKVVTLESKETITKDTPVAIPMEFAEPVEMSQVSIALGENNRPSELMVEVEVVNEDGSTSIEEYPYSEGAVARTSAVYAAGNVININLGNKVPVKKVTIKVTKVEDENSKLVDIAKVEFLEDVLENAQPPEKGTIKNLKVTSGDQELTVTWDQVSNVTGYKVEYGDESGNYTQSINVTTNKATLENFGDEKLVNYTPYYIVVTATNGDWQGERSEEVVGIPKPASVPLAPDNPRAEAGNEKIYFSWKAPESAEGYNVYYKAKADAEYQKVSGIKDTKYAINGLQNGVEYEMYVTAYNQIGEGKPSTSVVAIPKKEDIEIPDVPTYRLINTPNGNAEGIKTDHIIKVEMVDKNNVAAEYPADFNIEDVVDGDYYTHWTARTYQRSKGITVTFDKPYEMDHLAYISRLDGKYKDSLYKYSITVWESDDAEPRKLVSGQLIPGYSKDGLAILPFERSMVKKITVEVAQWDGSPTDISASELKFYEYYGLNDDIKNLFANETYTELSSTATQEEINRLRDMVNGLDGRYYLDSEVLLEELAMAEALLQGSKEKLGKVVDVYSGRSTYEDGKRGFAMGLNTDQPLGIVAKAKFRQGNETELDKKIVVYVDAPAGVTDLPSLVFTQYHAEPGNYRKSVPLTRGRNVIKVPTIGSYSTPTGGSVYVSATNVEGIKLHIKGIEYAPNQSSVTHIPMLSVLDLNPDNESAIKVKLRAYIEELTAYVNQLGYKQDKDGEVDYRNSTEIETRFNLLSLPATKILKGIQAAGEDIDSQVEALWQTLNAWDETMTLHYTMMGLSEDAPETYNQFPTSRMNTRYMRMFAKAFMYATSGHIGIGYNSVPGTMQGKSGVNGQKSHYFGWGINHEIGHVLNDKHYAFAEVTNNIFSLFAQEANGDEIRIKAKYPAIYEKVSVPTEGRPGDVFVNLGMYWQLHLAYDDDKKMEKDDFYPRLHRAYRESKELEGLSKEEGFALIASEVAGEDLTEFFTHWGFKLSEKAKSAIAAKGLPEAKKIYYLNDDAFDYRLGKRNGLSNTAVTVDVKLVAPPKENAKDENNSYRTEIEITVPGLNKEHILGYEILRNDEVIGFTTETTYTDIIGAANNRAFEYSVKVYDKLLNEVGTSNVQEVKVSHDGELSKAGWTVESTATGGILIDMGQVNSIAGIKFNGLAEGQKDYTVTVKSANTTTGSAIGVDLDGLDTTTGPAIGVSDWIVAKEGSIDTTEGLEYFNKPGAPSSDTRIWTYDARYVQIEGIDNLTLDQIDLVSYPGDNVEIRPGAIGKLGHDYRYGDREEDVIKAGTVVIVGDYRGDAVYNVIKPRGVFEVASHGEYKEEMHIINGYGLMLAEIPEDGAVSTVSDGIWIYVPDEEPFVGALGESGSITENMTEEEKELLEATKAVLQRIKVELYRVDNAETLEGERLVSDTIWIEVPAEDEMPTINLVGNN